MRMHVLVRMAAAVLPWAALAASMHAHGTPLRPGFRVMGARQGLANSAIDAIVRDHRGVVWMATEDGLIRHAGRDFTTFRRADTPWLPGNSIQALHVDANDSLWIAVLGKGVVRLGADRRQARLFDTRSHPDLADVWAVQADGDDVWFGTANSGLLRWNSRSGRWTRIAQLSEFEQANRRKIVTLLRQGPADIWIGTAGGLLHWKDGALHAVDLPKSSTDPVIYSLLLAHGVVWIGTAEGVFYIGRDGHPKAPHWTKKFAKPNAALQMASDAPDRLWIAAQRGLWRVENNAPREVSIEGSLSGKPVRGLYLQSDQGVWVSAPGTGLAYLRPDWKAVSELGSRIETPSDPGSRDYRALAAARAGGWWMAATGGILDHVDADGEALSRPIRLARNWRPKALLDLGNDGQWMAARDALVRFRNGRVQKVFDPGSGPDAVPDVGLEALRAAGNGRFWLSAPGWGVQLRDASGKVLKSVRNDESSPVGVQAIDAHADTALFAVVDGRLFVVNDAEERFEPITVEPSVPFDAVAVASSTQLWAHAADGLYAFERAGSRWRTRRRIPADPKWRDLDAKGLQIDPDGRVWLATSRGLFVFDARHTKVFDVGNGLSNQQLISGTLALATGNRGAAVIAENGRVLQFATPSSSSGVEWPRMGPIEVFARDKGQWRSLENSQGSFNIPAASTEVRLRFNAIAYDDPDSVHYATRVAGLDRAWIDLGTTGERILTRLDPGSHAVSVRAVDGMGRATEVRTVSMHVQPLWWQSAPFKALLGVCILVAAMWSTWSARQRVRKRRELARALQMEREHARASAAKSTFLATLGHEIRTPMTGVLGMSELLSDSHLTPVQMQRVNSIRKSSEHLLRIVDDALDVARIEAGKLEFIDARFEINALLEELAEWATPACRRRGLRFAFLHAVPDGAAVVGDVVRVRQVLMNLVGNAVKFTAQGSITLRHSIDDGNGHLFEIADTGPGMNPEQCQRVFSRFEQADGALTAHRHGGSGLGLAICVELVTAMGGRLWVESEPGAGSRFYVRLPLPNAPTVQSPSALHAPEKCVRQCDVLLVEDDETVGEVLSAMLARAGHRVVHVCNGLNALVELSSLHFDLALLDLDLPAIGGFELAKQLRSAGFRGPLLAVSARADEAAAPAALHAGFDDFLRKPIRAADLLACVDRLMKAAPASAAECTLEAGPGIATVA